MRFFVFIKNLSVHHMLFFNINTHAKTKEGKTMTKRKHSWDAAAKNNSTPTESMTSVEFSDEKFSDELPKRDTQSPRSKGK